MVSPAVAACAGGGIVWKKEFGAEASLASICVDPSDARRICVAGNRGSLTVLRFAPVVTRGANDAPAAGHPGDGAARELKVAESQTYQVDVKAGDTLRCGISATRDLLFVLLPREVRRNFVCSFPAIDHAQKAIGSAIRCDQLER